MAGGIPCSSEDGNEAVLIISSLLPGSDLPTQSLCMECAPAFCVAILAQFTGVDVSDYLYAAAEAAAAEQAGPEEPPVPDEAEEPDPTPPTRLAGRTRAGSSRARTADGGERDETTVEDAATSDQP